MNELQRKRLRPVFILGILLIAGVQFILKTNYKLINQSLENLNPYITYLIVFCLFLCEAIYIINYRFKIIKWITRGGILGFIISLPISMFFGRKIIIVFIIYGAILGGIFWTGNELWKQQKQIDFRTKIINYEKIHGRGSYFKKGGPGYMPSSNIYYLYDEEKTISRSGK